MYRDVWVCLLIFSAGVIWSPLILDNFSNAKDTLSAVASLATIIGVGVASYVGLYGLKEWRRQMTHGENHDLAKRSLRALQKLKMAIELVREPGLLPEVFKLEKETDTTALDPYIKAFANHWDSLSESFDLMRSCVLEAKILWGEELSSLFGQVALIRWKLYLAYQTQIAIYRNLNNPIVRDTLQRRMDKQRHILTSHQEDNSFDKEIDGAFSKIEAYLDRHLVRDK